jgi:hypothetical protein
MRKGRAVGRSKGDVVAFETVGDGAFAEVILLLCGGWTLRWTLLCRSGTLVTAAAAATATIACRTTCLLLRWRRAVAALVVATLIATTGPCT